MLEPSSDNPLNMECFSYYMENPSTFESRVQTYIRGGVFNGVHYTNVSLNVYEDDDYYDPYEDDYFDEYEDEDALAMIRGSFSHNSEPMEREPERRSLKRSAYVDDSSSIVAYGVNKKMRQEEVIDPAWTRLTLDDGGDGSRADSSAMLQSQRQRDCFNQVPQPYPGQQRFS